jgi:hypothetical protein
MLANDRWVSSSVLYRSALKPRTIDPRETGGADGSLGLRWPVFIDRCAAVADLVHPQEPEVDLDCELRIASMGQGWCLCWAALISPTTILVRSEFK